MANGVYDAAISARRTMRAQRLPSVATVLFMLSAALFIWARRSRGRRGRGKELVNCGDMSRARYTDGSSLPNDAGGVSSQGLAAAVGATVMAQKGRKKGRQGSSSSYGSEVKCEGSASIGSTPHVVPTFRCVRPRQRWERDAS